MADAYDLACSLFGARREEESTGGGAVSAIYADAVAASSDGLVEIYIGDDGVTEGEEYDDDGNMVSDGTGGTVLVPTSVSVAEGDTVILSLMGGVAKTPVVTANVGEGDRQDAAIAEADAKADEATAQAQDAAAKAGEAKSLAQGASSDAAKASDAAAKAQQSADAAKADAADAGALAKSASDAVAPITAEFDAVKSSAYAAADAASDATTRMEYDYARKTDLTEAAATLRSEISQSAAGWSASAYYSAKAQASEGALESIEAAKAALDQASAALAAADADLAESSKRLDEAAAGVISAGEQLAAATRMQDDAQASLELANIRLSDANAALEKANASGDTDAIAAAEAAVAEAGDAVEQSNAALAQAQSATAAARTAYDSAVAAHGSAKDAVDASRESYGSAYNDYLYAMNGFTESYGAVMQLSADGLRVSIEDAARTATDYMSYTAGGLEIGHAQSDVKMQLTNEQMRFVAAGAAMASFGRENGIWRMLIDNASISDSLSFGGFSWIRRANGNLTLKWTGE